MDKGVWISWYNLPQERREEYLAWLHDRYIPHILSKAGVLWVAHYANEKSAEKEPRHDLIGHAERGSVAAGDDYALLFGAETAYAFTRGGDAYMRQAPHQLHAGLSAEDCRMLALRTDERVAVMSEVARRDGPEAVKQEGASALSPCIQLGTFQVRDAEAEEELLAWFADWRFRALGNLPGCVRIRHMVAVSGWAKHGVLYEFASREAREAHFPHLRKLYPAEAEWTNGLLPKLLHAPGSPFVGARIWPRVA